MNSSEFLSVGLLNETIGWFEELLPDFLGSIYHIQISLKLSSLTGQQDSL